MWHNSACKTVTAPIVKQLVVDGNGNSTEAVNVDLGAAEAALGPEDPNLAMNPAVNRTC